MEDRLPRKLAAILYADVAGYSRLTGEDEDATHRRLAEYLDQIALVIDRHGGRVMHYAGDAVLAMFEAVVDALSCAAQIQNDLKSRNEDLADKRKVQFRIGVNLGDVIEDRNDIYGDGVNVAARLESLGEAGGICISESVHTAVGNKLPFDYEYLGEQEVKNIAKPVKAYHARLTPGAVLPPPRGAPRKGKHMQRPVAAVVVVLLVVVGGVLTWLRPWEPREEPASIERMAFPLPDKPSIAVLPFTNMSDDLKQEYFVDGMTEDLITDLSKISGLFVIARNSVFSYKGKSVKVRQVAEDLGVRYVLEGSVRRADDKIRINAQLIDATTGGHVWAERYDSSSTDIFAVQDKVTQRIVTALAINLTAGEQERRARTETDSQEAYDAFLRGWSHYLLRTPDNYAKAIPFLENAIASDPQYARAHAALAAIYWETWDNIWAKQLGVSNLEADLRAKTHLKEALKNPTPLAHRIAAKIHGAGQYWDQAMTDAERAITLDPNDPNGYEAMSILLVDVGRPAEGLEFIKKAMRLDPRSDYLYRVGDAQFHMERYEEAAATLLRASKRNPGNEWNFLLLAAAYGHLARDEEAASAIETFNSLRSKLGQEPYTLTLISDWNFKERGDRERLRTGLKLAGLAEGNTAPGAAALTGDQVTTALSGNTASGQNAYGETWHSYSAPDGRFAMLSGGRKVEGTWEVAKDGLWCRHMNSLGGGGKVCWIYFKKDDEYEYWYPDGSGMRGKFRLRPGNPENL